MRVTVASIEGFDCKQGWQSELPNARVFVYGKENPCHLAAVARSVWGFAMKANLYGPT